MKITVRLIRIVDVGHSCIGMGLLLLTGVFGAQAYTGKALEKHAKVTMTEAVARRGIHHVATFWEWFMSVVPEFKLSWRVV